MIATALTFTLGFLVALLVALLLAPILWRKARSFARRDFEATIPVTANEIRAEFDRVRAEAAMTVRRSEVETVEMRQRLAAAQADLGRAHVGMATLGKRIKDLQAEMQVFAAERDNIRQTFAAHRDKERQLSETLDEAKRDGSLNAEELEALATRFRETLELAEERKVEIVAAETRIERLTDTLRSVERASLEKDTLIRLLRSETGRTTEEKPRGILRSGAMPGLIARVVEKIAPDTSPSVEPPRSETPSRPSIDRQLQAILDRPRTAFGLGETEGAEVRDRIAEVAAHVIYRTAIAEGKDSPLAPLLQPLEDDTPPPSDDRPSNLAERVRRLAKSDQPDRTPRRLE